MRMGKGAAASRPVLSLLHLAAGDCGGCSAELAALQLPPRALEFYGMRLVSSPREADLLLVSGALTHAMADAVEMAWRAMPQPRWLVAVGTCALDGGCFKTSYAVAGGLDGRLPVALAIPGCPPTPERILSALRGLIDGDEAQPAPAAEPQREPASSAPGLPPDGPAADATASPAPAADPLPPALPPPPEARLPAAPRHRLSGDDSSGR
jgi:Ni,Fe-hydrogenase III small subunit